MNKDFSFKIEGNDAVNMSKFRKLHEKCACGSAGDKMSYTFTPTAMGVAITVKCSCGQKLMLGNFMDYDSGNFDKEKNRPLTKEDLINKEFEEDVMNILFFEDPRSCRIASASDQTFDMIFFYAVGLATHADKRISSSILYKYPVDGYHSQKNNYTGTEQENIALFYKHFKEKIRGEVKKYDCQNKRLLAKLQ